jgi:hypothetical protein
MIISEVFDQTPTTGDVVFIECGDTLIESQIIDMIHGEPVFVLDESAISIIGEGPMNWIKRKLESTASSRGLRAFGYIIGVWLAHNKDWKPVLDVLGSAAKINLEGVLQSLQRNPHWLSDPAIRAGIEEGVSAVKTNDPVLDDVLKLKYDDVLASSKLLIPPSDDNLTEAEYQGRKVSLGKPFLTPDGPKKRSVYVKNPKGNVVKVNFGQKGVKIKKSNPARRKSFRARHNCSNAGPRHKARYWSCKFW